MKRVAALLQILFVLIAAQAQAALNVCPRMPVTAGSAGQFVSAISASGAVTLGTPTATVNVAPPIRRALLSGSSATFNKDYVFVITSGSATAAATYTNNGNTYTVYATVASATQVVMSGGAAPTSSGTLTKSGGTGDSTLTFSAVLAPLYFDVEMSGGGGGGGGGAAGGTGGNGNTTSFGTSLLSVGGGAGGSGATYGGGGSTGTITAPAYGATLAGGNGNGGAYEPYGPGIPQSGPGGNNPFGGAGNFSTNDVGKDARANTGGGGAGGTGNSSSNYGGGGGGAGGYIHAIVPVLNATYTYTVGTGGAGGTSSANAGGAGAAGIIIVTEYFQ